MFQFFKVIQIEIRVLPFAVRIWESWPSWDWEIFSLSYFHHQRAFPLLAELAGGLRWDVFESEDYVSLAVHQTFVLRGLSLNINMRNTEEINSHTHTRSWRLNHLADGSSKTCPAIGIITSPRKSFLPNMSLCQTDIHIVRLSTSLRGITNWKVNT